MTKNSTYSDLLLYAYNETDLLNSDRIQRSIDGDPLVQNQFNELVETMNLLEGANPVVSDELIRKIKMHC